jgi:hypothetical protein
MSTFTVLRRFVDGLNPQTHVHCYTPHATVNRIDLYQQLNEQLNQLMKLPSKIRKSDLFEQIQRATRARGLERA